MFSSLANSSIKAIVPTKKV
ncbi:hypothetical protein [Nodularia sphaerocarpa]